MLHVVIIKIGKPHTFDPILFPEQMIYAMILKIALIK